MGRMPKPVTNRVAPSPVVTERVHMPTPFAKDPPYTPAPTPTSSKGSRNDAAERAQGRG